MILLVILIALFDSKRGIPIEQQFGLDETFTNDEYLSILLGYTEKFS